METWYENPFVCAIVSILLIVLLICGGGWISSGYQARMYNDKFKTQYSQAEFFWASTTIKSFINEGEQQTINIKGLTKE